MDATSQPVSPDGPTPTTAGTDGFFGTLVDPNELWARIGVLVRLKRHTDALDPAESVARSLVRTIEARDGYTEAHCTRLAEYGTALGRTLGLPDGDLRVLWQGGIIHDLGKVAIPDAILLKPGPLTEDEFSAIKQHTVVGDTLCEHLCLPRSVRPVVRHHHEHWDGSGYPDGLRGDAIPLPAQIIGLVDVYDALTTNRPYRTALRPERAAAILREEACRGWRQRELVEAFLGSIGH
jgi:putative two-component system response regulator